MFRRWRWRVTGIKFPAFLGSLVMAIMVAGAEGRTFYVSPSGNDSNSGEKAEQPFKTVTRARDAVRAARTKATEGFEVILRGGRYSIDQTILFDSRDSGSKGYPVVYRNSPGEIPVISGGRRIEGWKRDSGQCWKAATGIENFRQLYVNGHRAIRARGKIPGEIELHGESGYRVADSKLADWGNPSDIELCYYVTWTHSRCKVQSITKSDGAAVIAMLEPHFRYARTKEGVRINLPDWIENALELVDEPGEWYLSRPDGSVYYLPRPGEEMETVEVIAPVVERLVELRGTLEKPVHDIVFQGITFAHAGWLQPSRIGHADVQANFLLDPARLLERDGALTTVHNEDVKSPSGVVCHAARSVRFERCTFTKLGSGGLDLEHGAQDNVVSGCEFYDISGTAVQVGDVLKSDHHPDDERKVVKNNCIENNHIHDVCVEYEGGVAVFIGYTDGTAVRHNEIHALPYSGISVGWGWGEEDAGGGSAAYYQPFRYDTPTPAKNNRIEFNHIHHVMLRLNDGGGIYTLSNQPGTVIQGNHIHDNPGSPGGIYFDEGSGFIEVTGNLVYNVQTPMNFNNRTQDRISTCKVHDNYFDMKPGEADADAKSPSEARRGIGEVVERAGLEEGYRDLLR